MFSWTFTGNKLIRLCQNEITLYVSMLNVVFAVVSRVVGAALLISFTYGLVTFSNNMLGDMDVYRVVDHFLDISVDECWKECGRHMSCVHAAYERGYRLCTLLEGPDTPPIPPPGFVVASKASGDIVVSK